MSIVSGTRLGSYQIVAPLGAGGMGEVYRASDTKLGRQVALKLLPADVSGDPERLQRLKREAQMLAALNHPHIASIHGLEESNGHTFLVLELVEGEDLAARIAAGPIPLDEALAIAKQIAEALESAHEGGIVHRDLKPANVKLKPDGSVKLLDFGLAKAFSGEAGSSSSPDLSRSPTMSHMATQAGVILGTAPYMSPEQARGRPVDKRSDVWAFGVVLYEMLTGERLFTGETVSDVVASILKSEPDLNALPPETPLLVKSVLRRCLRKDPRQRLHDIADARIELEEAQSAPPEAARAAAAPARRAAWLPWSVATALALALALLGVLAAGRRKTEAPRRSTVRFTLHPPQDSWFTAIQALSPDGTKLLYATRDTKGNEAVWIRRLDELEAKPLPMDAPGLRYAFWSPDGRSIAFGTRSRLVRADIADGRMRTICDASLQFGGTWGSLGDILFVPAYGAPIHRVPAEGGTPVPITKLDEGAHEVAHLLPRFLPDGRRFLFFARVKHQVQPREGWICAASLDGKEVKRLRPVDMFVGVTADAILYMEEDTLLAQRYDPRTLALVGEPVAIPGRVRREGDASTAFASASWNGVLALRSDPKRLQKLVQVDRTGRPLREIGAPEEILSFARLSADGRRIVTERRDPRTSLFSIWLVDTERGITSRSGSDRVEERFPGLSPDGTKIVFSWDRDGPYDLVVRSLNGDAPDRVVLASRFDKTGPFFSPDGASIVFDDNDPGSLGFKLMPAGGGQATRIQEGVVDNGAELTPDGKWLLYSSPESGRPEVYARRVGANGTSGTSVRVSVEGGRSPRVRADGREVYFVSLDNRLMAAAWEAGAPAPRAPVALFQTARNDYLDSADIAPFDVSKDGKTFVVVQPVDATPVTEITIVLDGLYF